MSIGCLVGTLKFFSHNTSFLSDNILKDYLRGTGKISAVSEDYSGYQFLSPELTQLGDGRSHSFEHGGRVYSVKGSGQTRFSRPGADGRASFRSVCREYFGALYLSQILIPTVEPVAILHSSCPSDRVVREPHYDGEFYLYSGGLLVRHNEANPRLLRLTSPYSDEASSELFPSCELNDRLCVFGKVEQALASVSASIQAAGFVHGVLNSDNILLTGEVIDLNVFNFLSTLNYSYTPNFIDDDRVFSYGNQSLAVLVNLEFFYRDLMQKEVPSDVSSSFSIKLAEAFSEQLSVRLGVKTEQALDDDLPLFPQPHVGFGFLNWIEESGADYQQAWAELRKCYVDSAWELTKETMDAVEGNAGGDPRSRPLLDAFARSFLKEDKVRPPTIVRRTWPGKRVEELCTSAEAKEPLQIEFNELVGYVRGAFKVPPLSIRDRFDGTEWSGGSDKFSCGLQ
jgi:uncharacterized protein YdiU (UPF0061 family)